MAVASWPTELPRPNREGYQGSPGEGRQKKRNEAGPPGYRRRTSSIPKYVSMTLDVSRDQLARFERFYEDEVADGSLPFFMPDPTTTGWPMLTTDGRILTDHLGRPLLLEKTWLCLFGETLPTHSPKGNQFQLSFQIVVMP